MSMKSIKHGVYGGLAGGVVFGALMAMMGMLPMIGNMVGVPWPWVGFFVHLMISATIGAVSRCYWMSAGSAAAWDRDWRMASPGGSWDHSR